jgi:hypothetical protein
LPQQAAAGEAELQRMARNLTVAVAPDDFKAADQLEPQAGAYSGTQSQVWQCATTLLRAAVPAGSANGHGALLSS